MIKSRNVNLKKIVVPQNVLDVVPAHLAKRYQILPISITDDLLTVAIAPGHYNDAAISQIETMTSRSVVIVEADNENSLKKAVERYYSEVDVKNATNANILFNRILNRALQARASDVHITPSEKGGFVKMRVDGQLRTDSSLSQSACAELVSVIKIIAKLDIAEKRTPLDGNITIKVHGDAISLRVATIPTVYGEHITLRLLSQSDDTELESIEHLGMSPEHLKLFQEAIENPNGIILLSGPTGSGKTTTLYAALRQLRGKGNKHLVSIEDPVEKPVDGVTQIRVDSDNERVTFNKALRSVLRHDPDVIMIGEIRDSETADIAVKSSLTGHLVLSTLHTNSAAGVLTRLVNLGISPYLIASTLRLAVAQRLVRTPCPNCVGKRRPTESESIFMGWDPKDESIMVPEIKGCSLCGQTGYVGRIGLYEMIPIEEGIREVLLEKMSDRAIAEYAYQTRNLPTIRQDGARKVLLGLTSVEDVRATTTEMY